MELKIKDNTKLIANIINDARQKFFLLVLADCPKAHTKSIIMPTQGIANTMRVIIQSPTVIGASLGVGL